LFLLCRHRIFLTRSRNSKKVKEKQGVLKYPATTIVFLPKDVIDTPKDTIHP
jgi:hypothetical protein